MTTVYVNTHMLSSDASTFNVAETVLMLRKLGQHVHVDKPSACLPSTLWIYAGAEWKGKDNSAEFLTGLFHNMPEFLETILRPA